MFVRTTMVVCVVVLELRPGRLHLGRDEVRAAQATTARRRGAAADAAVSTVAIAVGVARSEVCRKFESGIERATASVRAGHALVVELGR